MVDRCLQITFKLADITSVHKKDYKPAEYSTDYIKNMWETFI